MINLVKRTPVEFVLLPFLAAIFPTDMTFFIAQVPLHEYSRYTQSVIIGSKCHHRDDIRVRHHCICGTYPHEPRVFEKSLFWNDNPLDKRAIWGSIFPSILQTCEGISLTGSSHCCSCDCSGAICRSILNAIKEEESMKISFSRPLIPDWLAGWLLNKSVGD